MNSTFLGVRWYSVQICPWVPSTRLACVESSAGGTGS